VKPVDVLGLNVEVGSGEPIVLLREVDEPHRVLPISIGGREALAIAMALSGEEPPRPLTHDLLAAIIDTLDVTVERVEVTAIRDGTFLAELVVRGPSGGALIDSRPSDAIALALRVDAPLFASEEVLDEAGAVLLVEDEDDDVELAAGEVDPEELERFRSFLESIDPSDFGTVGEGGEPDAGPDEPDR
jgi:bifunctional DNase/RNase